MREHVAHRDVLLAALRELGPVLRDAGRRSRGGRGRRGCAAPSRRRPSSSRRTSRACRRARAGRPRRARRPRDRRPCGRGGRRRPPRRARCARTWRRRTSATPPNSGSQYPWINPRAASGSDRFVGGRERSRRRAPSIKSGSARQGDRASARVRARASDGSWPTVNSWCGASASTTPAAPTASGPPGRCGAPGARTARYEPRGHDEELPLGELRGATVAFVDMAPANAPLRALARVAGQRRRARPPRLVARSLEAERRARRRAARARATCVHFDLEHSGAVLAWRHFHPGSPSPSSSPTSRTRTSGASSCRARAR